MGLEDDLTRPRVFPIPPEEALLYDLIRPAWNFTLAVMEK